jgi:large subunit ribosomal protein L15
MQIHSLKRRTPNKKSVQVGRGGTRGKTAGRGTKGQNARAGRKKRPEIRDTIKRVPKLRGRGISALKSIQSAAFAVNLRLLEETFSAGDTVSPKTLTEKGIIETVSGRTPTVKILATGEITKKLTIKNCAVSKSAEDKIVKAGGSVSNK